MESKDVPSIVSKLQIGVLCTMLVLFPLAFIPNSTDSFTMGKSLILILGTSLLILLWAIASIYKKGFVYKSSPFNLPVALFGVVVLISSLLSRNMYDSLVAAVPVVFSCVLYFTISYMISSRKTLILAITSLIAGGALTALLSTAYYLKLYFLPIPGINNQYFSPFGSGVQEAIYLIALLMFPLFSLLRQTKTRKLTVTQDFLIEAGLGGALLIGVIFITLSIITSPTKPIILPYTYGLQIAAATISQDISRLFISFPFGSGFGTFLNDFARFRLQELNANTTFATAYPSYSSSFALELMTTTGILGILSYLFIVFKALKTRMKDSNPSYFGLVILFIVSFFLPFGLPTIALVFILLGVYSSSLFLANDRRVHNTSLSLVAFDQGIISTEDVLRNERVKSESIILPVLITILVVLIGGFASFMMVRLVDADTKMVSSLVVPAGKKLTIQQQYDLQRNAVNEFPYKSDYQRTFSQLNMNLANSIAASLPKGATPSAVVQQSVNQLLQQSVNSARSAADIAPLTSTNWSNLAQIYRNLIGVGQGADQFAIAAMNQATLLDPTNPFLRLDYGGIYYQLSQLDAAQNQFQIAINLKPDFANAYYNLGHVIESKGDLSTALSLYQTTLSLAGNNPTDKKKLSDEIEALKKKINETAATQQQQTPVNLQTSAGQQQPIGINAPSAQFPAPSRPVKLPPPPGASASPEPSPSAAPRPTATPTQ
ncbi:MAG: tetratricopeptide repeat protein [Candidatus Levyibacteriota bacterium]